MTKFGFYGAVVSAGLQFIDSAWSYGESADQKERSYLQASLHILRDVAIAAIAGGLGAAVGGMVGHRLDRADLDFLAPLFGGAIAFFGGYLLDRTAHELTG